MIYLLSEYTFSFIGKGPVQFSEWISKKSITPIAKIEIEPSDFYFIDKVATHRSNESTIKSWLLYKLRNIF